MGDSFAHGKTAHQALQEATAKALRNEPLDKRIKRVVKQYPDADVAIANKELYSLHNLLTGSCEFGRKQFAEEHSIDIANGSMTMREFIHLTSNAYGSEAIKALAKAYKIEL